MIAFLLFSLLVRIVSTQTPTETYTNPNAFPGLSGYSCVLQAATHAAAVGTFLSCTDNWTCICNHTNFPDVLSSQASAFCSGSPTDDVSQGLGFLTPFCAQFQPPSSAYLTPPPSSAYFTPHTSSSSTISSHAGGLTPPQKVGLGVGIGLGVPILLAVAIGVWCVIGAKKKPRVARVEKQIGEPIHLGRM